MTTLNIRKTTDLDLPFVMEMIHELAKYEKAPESVTLTLDQLSLDFKQKLFESIILERDGEKVGMALFYFRYSTWKGKNLYLEDLFVIPEHRGLGLGKMVMKYLANY